MKMKVYNPQGKDLTDGLKSTLSFFRTRRKFDVQKYVEVKSFMINEYFRKYNLKGAVLGVSGGIDSAVVLALLKKAKEEKGSPIQKVIAVSLPVFKEGASGQKEATDKGQEVIKAMGFEPKVIDLSSSFETLSKSIENQSFEGKPWARGQLVSYLRTPSLYYLTSLMSQEGLPSIVAGTINKDEGGYIGYFGKAGDGLVDLQLISDIHKSEVYAVGKFLNVPEEVLKSVPTGDMYDARPDEEVFGTSYDFIELYTQYLESSLELRDFVKSKWNKEDSQRFDELSKNVENLHGYNKHKYLSSSVAIHLDVLKTSVEGGWKHQGNLNNLPFPSKAVNLIPPPSVLNSFSEITVQKVSKGWLLKGVLTALEVKSLKEHTTNFPGVPVGIDGYLNNYKQGDIVGSIRRSFYSPDSSKILFERIKSALPFIREQDNNPSVDAIESPYWEPVGINPLFRSILYPKNGFLIPHYDAPVVFSKNTTTLMSFVLYLDDCVDNGRTRFIKGETDPEFKDHSQIPKEEDVLESINAESGDVLIFDHRVLHDGEKTSKEKHIIRTDIIFEARNGRI